MVGDKLRFRFRKAGPLRLLSHLDLMRCFERMLRRAALPFKMTAGFHPTPRLVFALSLPLGVDGADEVAELELTEPLDADDVLTRLAAQAPGGLTFTGVRVVPMKASAVPRRVVYTLPLPADRAEAARAAAAALLAEPKVWVDRYHPRPRRVNVRPYLRDIQVRPHSEEQFEFPKPTDRGPCACSLSLDLWVTGTGTARADDLLRLLGLADLPDAGAVLARTALEIRDEVTADPADAPPDGPPETLPLDHAAVPAAADDDRTAEPAWGLSPSGPVVE